VRPKTKEKGTKTQPVKDYLVPITAIVAITILLAIAQLKEVDGTALASGLALIAGIGGYTLKVVKDKRSKK